MAVIRVSAAGGQSSQLLTGVSRSCQQFVVITVSAAGGQSAQLLTGVSRACQQLALN